MRIISTRTKYGLRAMYCLARHYGEGPLLVQTIANEEKLPKKFLELVLLIVKAGGLVSSKPGRGGGYYLTQSPEDVTVGQVVRLIEGPLAPLPCASETAYERCPECPSETQCGTQLVMRKVRNATAAILDRTSLADVCFGVPSEKQSAPPDQSHVKLLQSTAFKH
jgi:Rrf2 family protein